MSGVPGSTKGASLRSLRVATVVVGIGACSAPEPGDAPYSLDDATAPGTLADRLDRYLQAQVEEGFAGAVLVVGGDDVILDRTFLPGSHPAGEQVAFWIGSVSKQFTAAAILKLEEQGRVGVADAITRFFADVPGEKREITIHHLLSHTSGLGHRYAAEGITDRDEAVRAILAIPLADPPGTRYLYSNDGYSLLAAIVEIASGSSFEEYMFVHLLGPAGLHGTGFWAQERDASIRIERPQSSTRALRNRRAFRRGNPYRSYGFRGATGMFSTTRDLHRWFDALSADSVLSQGGRQRLFTPAVAVRRDPGADIHYGYGWVLSVREGRLVEARHSGDEDWLGHNALVRLWSDTVMIVLSSAGERRGLAWSTRVSRGLLELLSPEAGAP
jgi:CubicO group peptidase (beta-lactamase class C family)